MTDDTKRKELRALRRLFDFADDGDLTAEEAQAELEADGVNVDAALKRTLAFVAAKRKEVRLAAWQTAAREKAKQFGAKSNENDYSTWSLPSLVERAKTLPLQQVSHRNFEDMTREDLVTLLTDADDLADDNE